ncbi:hypothetical protein LTR85_004548 [Meristemomyces frigidus]|nr:hypothetical protein LTR85_004548 [Meristemomyces frigidus]
MSEKDVAEVKAASSPTSSTNADEAAHTIDPRVERRILRKLDLRVVPMLWFLFLVSFVDRGNIGNAKIQGMTKSLHITKGNKYNMAVMVFTVAYVVCGVPANIVFRKLGPKSLSAMMFIWGLFAMGQGFTKTWAGLVACRFMMGIFEAGFVPGCAYLIGSYYRKDEFLRRYTVFFSAAIIAGAFNGLFATLLAMADGAGGLKGWQWIFVCEGLITCCVALVSVFLIVNWPEKTKLLTPEEKAVLLERLRQDGGEVVHDRIRKHVVEALLDWKVWLGVLTYIGAEENASAVVAFQPTVLKGLGWTSTSAQVHSIPIYCVAFVASLSCAFLSEHLRQRYFFALFGATLTLVGLAIEIAQPHSDHVKYAGMFFITAGAYVTMPIMVVWTAINVGKGYKRTVAFGLVIATGFSVGMGMNCLSIACMTALYIGLRLENKKRDSKPVETTIEPNEELSGENHPAWRYQL